MTYSGTARRCRGVLATLAPLCKTRDLLTYCVVRFASRCQGRRLSTWPTTGVSCPTALGAVCDQLTFRLAWCRQHSAVMATELLQPPDLACGTLFQSSCVIPTSPTDCSDDSWRDTFFRKAWTRRSVTSAIRRHRQTLTYLLTDRQTFGRHADNGHFGDIPFGRPVLACSTFHCRPPNEGSVSFLI